MSALHETAYPRFKSDLTNDELLSIYTPTAAEIRFARRQFNVQAERLAFLIQLKTVQRLGYFVKASEVPTTIRSHIAACAGFRHTKKTTLEKLNTTGARHRLRKLIRTRLKIKPYESGGANVVVSAAETAAATLHELPDIINAVIEELVHQRLELPGFTTLQRSARQARANASAAIFDTLSDQLSSDTKRALNELLVVDDSTADTQWQRLKREPKKPTNKEVRNCIDQLVWVEDLPDVAFIPTAKWRQCVLEARSFDAATS